jgi:tetratricopeptide (TPR) repeat protein
MKRLLSLMLLCRCFAVTATAQDSPPDSNQAPPRSDRDQEAGESSSRDTRVDLSPPKDDAKDHPNSAASLADADEDDASADVQEFHPWDPHKAMKDIEVGDFYFKKKNYRAALDRYREALVYKPNDALANFHMAQCLEKLDKPDEARTHYEEYLKITPHGPLAGEAKAALERLNPGIDKNRSSQKAQLKH